MDNILAAMHREILAFTLIRNDLQVHHHKRYVVLFWSLDDEQDLAIYSSVDSSVDALKDCALVCSAGFGAEIFMPFD